MGGPDETARLFAERHRELERAVQRYAHAPRATIQDACGHAWMQLVRQERLPDSPFGWLQVTAVREAWRLAEIERRTVEFGECDEDALEQWLGDGGRLIAAVEYVEDRRRDLALVPPRARRMLALRGTGLSYDEIGAVTGCTYRTVDRQLQRGRKALPPRR